MTRALRLGEIRFINALPLSLECPDLAGIRLEKTLLSPTGLNQAILNGDLDVSPVSSAFYLRHQDQFVLLEDLSISAEHEVESVLLFLPQGFEGITPETVVAIPDSSETSVALMQYLMARQMPSQQPVKTTVYPVGQGALRLQEGFPLLAIGDEALTLREQRPIESIPPVDLAGLWRQETGLPFVFAVWVARRDWAMANPDLLVQINQLLAMQKQAFFQEKSVQSNVLIKAKQQCPHLSEAVLMRYFTRALSYNLNTSQKTALSRFEQILRWLDDDNKHPADWNRPVLPIELLHR